MASFCLSVVLGILTLNSHTTSLTAVEFDHFILSHQWPVTFCKTRKCNQPLPAHWTLHGFWPSNSNGSLVSNCSNSRFGHESIPKGTLNEMKRIWPDLLKSTSSSFWSYQWQKHGTCADVDGTKTVAQYFSKAIELALRYNISTILKSRNIMQGNEIQIPDIEDGFRIETKHLPYILIKNVGQRPLWLCEIQLCFNKTFGLIDCHRRNTYKGRVLYPSLNQSAARSSISSNNGQYRNTATVAWFFLVFVIVCGIF